GDRVEWEGRRAVRAGARRADLVQQDRGLRHAEPGAAVFLWNDRAEPPGPRKGLDEVPGVFVLAVPLEPVVERERAREGGDFLADHLLLLGEGEVHDPDSNVVSQGTQGGDVWALVALV